MAKDLQPLDFDCEDFSSLLDNTLTTIPLRLHWKSEFNDNTLDSTLPCFDDISTSTQTSQKREAAKKKAEITFDPASIDTSNNVQAKRKRKQKWLLMSTIE